MQDLTIQLKRQKFSTFSNTPHAYLLGLLLYITEALFTIYTYERWLELLLTGIIWQLCIPNLFIAHNVRENCSCIFVLKLITSLAELHATNQ